MRERDGDRGSWHGGSTKGLADRRWLAIPRITRALDRLGYQQAAQDCYCCACRRDGPVKPSIIVVLALSERRGGTAARHSERPAPLRRVTPGSRLRPHHIVQWSRYFQAEACQPCSRSANLVAHDPPEASWSWPRRFRQLST